MSPLTQEERIQHLEWQFDRFVSDAESEKDTRRRVNMDISKRFDDIEQRLRSLERLVYIGLGGSLVIQALVGWLR